MNPEAYQAYLKACALEERWIFNDLKSALVFVDRSIAQHWDQCFASGERLDGERCLIRSPSLLNYRLAERSS